jgi:beta-phosphoglucomutase
MFTAAIFDLDGVIVDSHPLHKQAWRRLFDRLEKNVSEEELDFVLDGRRRAEILRHFFGDLPAAELQSFGQLKDAFFLASAEHLSLVPGVHELIAGLRQQRIPLAVATSATRKRAEILLNQFRLRSSFDAMVTGDDVNRGKPDPAVFLKAGEELHCRPGNTMVMEDAAAGVQGAKGAGMKCLGIAGPPRARRLYDAGADWVQPDFTTVRVSHLSALFEAQSNVARACSDREVNP